jgi:hypothetical protein
MRCASSTSGNSRHLDNAHIIHSINESYAAVMHPSARRVDAEACVLISASMGTDLCNVTRAVDRLQAPGYPGASLWDNGDCPFCLKERPSRDVREGLFAW